MNKLSIFPAFDVFVAGRHKSPCAATYTQEQFNKQKAKLQNYSLAYPVNDKDVWDYITFSWYSFPEVTDERTMLDIVDLICLYFFLDDVTDLEKGGQFIDAASSATLVATVKEEIKGQLGRMVKRAISENRGDINGCAWLKRMCVAMQKVYKHNDSFTPTNEHEYIKQRTHDSFGYSHGIMAEYGTGYFMTPEFLSSKLVREFLFSLVAACSVINDILSLDKEGPTEKNLINFLTKTEGISVDSALQRAMKVAVSYYEQAGKVEGDILEAYHDDADIDNIQAYCTNAKYCVTGLVEWSLRANRYKSPTQIVRELLIITEE